MPEQRRRNIVPGATYGRKQRITPLTKTTARLLRAWLSERGVEGGEPLFPTRQGQQLSRDALEQRLAPRRRASTARRCAPRRSPPRAQAHGGDAPAEGGIDTTVIALWFGA
jgi:integrase